MTTASLSQPETSGTRTAFTILAALSLCHLLNDTIQSLLPAIYPVLQENYALTFTQIGILHFAFQVTASLLQPAVGFYTDKRPMFRLATGGMGASLVGLARARLRDALLGATHRRDGDRPRLRDLPSRIPRGWRAPPRAAATASPSRFFQVGGNVGTAIGPLLAAFVVLPFGQTSIAWFAALALVGMVVLWRVGTWARHAASASRRAAPPGGELGRCRGGGSLWTIAMLGAAGLL